MKRIEREWEQVEECGSDLEGVKVRGSEWEKAGLIGNE